MPVDILLVDDHSIIRDGIKAILRGSSEFHVSSEARSGAEAVEICSRLKPPIVLMDINLPGLGGIEATIQILRNAPATRIIMLSMYDDRNSVLSALRAGARGFVLKSASENDLMDALRAVANGGSYLSPLVSDRLVSDLRNKDAQRRPEGQTLTPREIQILRLVADGKTSKEIAVLLNLEVNTVRTYRKTLMKKLGVSNTAGLVKFSLSSDTWLPAASTGGEK
jgi:DNA-binding NarL/FixJ family response regulator